MLLVKVSLCQKIISLKKGFWLQSCKMTGYDRAWTDYTECKNDKLQYTSSLFRVLTLFGHHHQNGMLLLFISLTVLLHSVRDQIGIIRIYSKCMKKMPYHIMGMMIYS